MQTEKLGNAIKEHRYVSSFFASMKFDIMTFYWGEIWIWILFEHKSLKNPRNNFQISTKFKTIE